MTHGVAHEGWDLGLRHGVAREDALIYTLLQARVEVKADGKFRRSNNLFVEYRDNGRLKRHRSHDG